MYVCMNDEFCADEEEDSELRVASLASLAIKKIV